MSDNIATFNKKIEALENELSTLKNNFYVFASESIKNGNLSLSNSNTTVEKLNSNDWCWYGIRCNENPFSSKSYANKKTFSIKIEKTEYACIVFGFCLKTADDAAKIGYLSTDYSYMLYLRDGNFRSRSFNCQYTETDMIQPALIRHNAKIYELLFEWEAFGSCNKSPLGNGGSGSDVSMCGSF